MPLGRNASFIGGVDPVTAAIRRYSNILDALGYSFTSLIGCSKSYLYELSGLRGVGVCGAETINLLSLRFRNTCVALRRNKILTKLQSKHLENPPSV